MHRIVKLFLSVMLFLFLISVAHAAKMVEDIPLTIINGIEYSSDDFLHWLENVRQEDDSFPDSPEKFIDWHLLVQEAKNMELNTLPAFRHKVDVFLKVRSLMMLKNEEVDSKISVSETEILDLYNTEYNPNRYIAELHFKKKKEADETFIKLTENKPGYADLYKYAGSGNTPAFMVKHPHWYRPSVLPEAIKKDLIGFQGVGFSKPFRDQGGFIIYQQLEIKENDKEDFQRKKKIIAQKMRKNKHYKLTEELIKKLKIKYNVQIDANLLESIDLLAPNLEDMDKVLISSNRSQVDVAYLVLQVKNRSNLMRELKKGKEQQLRFKWQTVNSMVSNSLVDWEGIDRHYEEKEPLKWVYQFYRQHRMIVELKKRIFKDITASDVELQNYYQQHKAEFKISEKVKLTYVHGGKKAIKSLWVDSISGKDIMKAARGIDVTLVYGASQEHNFKDLASLLQKKVAPLSKGEISTPFLVDGKYSLVRLESKTPSFVQSFEMVKRDVLKKVIQNKKDLVLGKLLLQLRQNSSIDIDNKIWDQIIAREKI